MLVRVLHPVSRREVFSMGTYAPADAPRNTTWGSYGPDGAFARMMAAIKAHPDLRAAGGYVICTQRVLQTPLGPVVQKRTSKFDL